MKEAHVCRETKVRGARNSQQPAKRMAFASSAALEQATSSPLVTTTDTTTSEEYQESTGQCGESELAT